MFFRYLFGDESRKGLLISFLNAVHADSGFPRIADVEIRNPYNLRDWRRGKESILDIHAVDETGRQYDIEVQTEREQAFKARCLYYWAHKYADQLEDGEEYHILKPVIFIGVLDFTLFPEIPRSHLWFLLREEHDRELVLTDHHVMHFLQIPYHDKNVIDSELKKWLTFLRYEGTPEEKAEMKILLTDEDINTAHKVYEDFTQDPDLREQYRAHQKWKRDQLWRLKNAERRGRDKQSRITAVKMIEEGMDNELISRVTEFSVEEIEKLRENPSSLQDEE
jgi:predicted transposase/invertase (TIGR01784 family)